MDAAHAALFSSLVHESVRGDVLTAARHQSFIASHLLGGLLALCVVPRLSRAERQAVAVRGGRLPLAAHADRDRDLPVAHRQVRRGASRLGGELRRSRHLFGLAHRWTELLAHPMDGGGAARGGACDRPAHRRLGRRCRRGRSCGARRAPMSTVSPRRRYRSASHRCCSRSSAP